MRSRLHEQRIDQDRDGGTAGHAGGQRVSRAAQYRTQHKTQQDQWQTPHGAPAEPVVIHSRCRCSHGSPHAVFLIKASASATRSNEAWVTFEGLRGRGTASPSIGRRTVTRVPSPRRLAIFTSPPCSATKPCTIESPRPVP